MVETPNNQELPFLAAVFTSLLCIFYGANAVAIKISLFGFGAFTVVGLRFSIAIVAIFFWARFTGQPITPRCSGEEQTAVGYTIRVGV